MATDNDGKIPLDTLFSALNRKDKEWWNTLTEKQQNGFSTWLYNRYVSIVPGSNADLQRYYILATNQAANINSSVLTKNHKQLQYLLLTTVPQDWAPAKHTFVNGLKRKTKKQNSKKFKVLEELHPEFKYDDLAAMANLVTDEELIQHLKDLAWSDEKIRKALAD